VIFLIDACRIAENSYFVKQREEEYKKYTYEEIAHEMFSYADGCTMSAKKDGLVNMGGFLALNDNKLSDECTNLLIITEGYRTYGGLSGRDMEALTIGLEEVFDPAYLNYRITSTTYLGEKLNEIGVPCVRPIGGHAVYIDAKEFYKHILVENYPGQALTCDLYIKGGIRSVEIGSVMFGKYYEKGKLMPAPMELVRLAIPRRVYTQSHIDYVIEVFGELVKSGKNSKGYKIIHEPKFLRHFTAWFEPVNEIKDKF
ncbi:MAG: tryptophanase, partial [Bacteroidota bacterium]|nr:tryptophanase [Bacteroidota bacterium]